jgi:uncharacterized protein YjeT (DUF2065 family)
MDAGLLLVILGIIIAVLVHSLLGVLLVILGLVLMLAPRVRR